MTRPALANLLGLAVLSCGAVFFGSACDPGTFEPGVRQIVLPMMGGPQFFNVCVPTGFSGLPYTRYTDAVNPDGSVERVSSDQVNSLSDCDYSVGTEDEVDPSVRAVSESETNNPGDIFNESVSPHPRASSGPNLVNALPYARPVPFVPLFSNQIANAIPTQCDSGGDRKSTL